MLASSALVVPAHSGCPSTQSNSVARRRQQAVVPRAAGGSGPNDRSGTPIDSFTRWAKQLVRADDDLTAQSKAKPKQNSGFFKLGNGKVRVKFTVADFPLPQGDDLLIVGDGQGFGKWNPSSAPVLQPERGNSWVYQLDLPPGLYKYKLVRIKADGYAEWEAGPYRELTVPEGSTAPINVLCNYDAIMYDAMTSQAEAEDLSSTVEQAELSVAKMEARQSVLQTAMQDLEKFLQERDNQIGQLQGITKQINQIEGDILTPRRRRPKQNQASQPMSAALPRQTPVSDKLGKDVRDALSSPQLQKYVDVGGIEQQVRSTARPASTNMSQAMKPSFQNPVSASANNSVANDLNVASPTGGGSNWKGGLNGTNGSNGFQLNGTNVANGYQQNGVNGSNGYQQQPGTSNGVSQAAVATPGFPPQPNVGNPNLYGPRPPPGSQPMMPQPSPSPIQSLGFAELPSRSQRASSSQVYPGAMQGAMQGLSPEMVSVFSQIKPEYLDMNAMNSLQSAADRMPAPSCEWPGPAPSCAWPNPAYQNTQTGAAFGASMPPPPPSQPYNGYPPQQQPPPYPMQQQQQPTPYGGMGGYTSGYPSQPPPPQAYPPPPPSVPTPTSSPQQSAMMYPSYEQQPSSTVRGSKAGSRSSSVDELLEKLREEMDEINLDDLRSRTRDGSLADSIESRLEPMRVGDKLRLEVPSRTQLPQKANESSGEVMDKAARLLGDEYVSALAQTRDYIRQFTTSYTSTLNGTTVNGNGPSPQQQQQYMQQQGINGTQTNGYPPSGPMPQWQTPPSTSQGPYTTPQGSYAAQGQPQLYPQGVANGSAFPPQPWFQQNQSGLADLPGPQGAPVNGQSMQGMLSEDVNGQGVNGQSVYSQDVNGQGVNGQGAYAQEVNGQGVNGQGGYGATPFGVNGTVNGTVNGQGMYGATPNGVNGTVNGTVNGQLVQNGYPQGETGVQGGQPWGPQQNVQPVSGQAVAPNGQQLTSNRQSFDAANPLYSQTGGASVSGRGGLQPTGVAEMAKRNELEYDSDEEPENTVASSRNEFYKKGSLTGIAIATTLLVAGDGCYRLAYKPVRDEIGNSCIKAMSDVAAMASFFTAVGYRFW